jgi:hypothetical protein
VIRNITGNESCGICLDDGWVELQGTVTDAVGRYPRGVTGCKWCEEGVRKLDKEYHEPLVRRPARLVSDYEFADIEPVAAPPDWSELEVRKAAKQAAQASFASASKAKRSDLLRRITGGHGE